MSVVDTIERINVAGSQGGNGSGAYVVPEAIEKMKYAFDVFESQSALLKVSYENLRRNLAVSNRNLNRKNRALATKVEELRQMSSRLQSILESITDGVLVVNRDLRIERCNPAAIALLGMEPAWVEGNNYADVVNGLGSVELLKAVINNGSSFLDEQRFLENRNGDRMTVLASVAPIWSHDGVVIGAVEIFRDVTRLRMLEERMNCQKRMAALGEMAASVAHEIRNPLGTIEGFARLLSKDLSDQPQFARLAGKIVEGAQNLNYVITNLLTYARPMQVQYEDFDINAFLADAGEALAGRALIGNVHLEIKTAGKGFNISADRRQVRQVLINLGINAIEACSGMDARGHVVIGAFRGRKKNVLFVSDNGCGISEADKQQLFSPFFTRKQGGTGLGLSLCHKIVSAHGGLISVESGVGRGSTFAINLPGNGGDGPGKE